MNKLKEIILTKSDVIHRQYMLILKNIEENKSVWDESKKRMHSIYAQKMPKIVEIFFSNNLLNQEDGLKAFKGLLSLRQWDDNIDDTFRPNNENKDKYKDIFVDDFNNFSEFYQFLKDLVKDVEEYHDTRINNLGDKKE